MDNNIEKFTSAKIFFKYQILYNKAKNPDGTVNIEKLDNLLREQYEFIRRKIEERKRLAPEKSTKIDNELIELDKLYALIKDEDSRKRNDKLAQQEIYAKKLPINPNSVMEGIIKKYSSKPLEDRWYNFIVSPEGEDQKDVLVIPKREYQYTTQLGLMAYLNEYEIVKIVSGKEMHFCVTTNTRFRDIDELLHKGQPLTENERKYIELFYKQMSDIHLQTCQNKFNGYIGTVENNTSTPIFDMNDEDAAVTKILRNREHDETGER